MLKRLGGWTANGFGPARVDRDELRRRLMGEELADWALTELADVAESAAAEFARRRRQDRSEVQEDADGE